MKTNFTNNTESTDRYRKYIDNFDNIQFGEKTYIIESTMRDDYYKSNTTYKDDGVYFWNEEWNSSPHGGFNYKCCQNCPNNPKNNPNASGICHCTLPIMETIRY